MLNKFILFLRSELYKKFWLFNLKSAVVVGATCSFALAITRLTYDNSRDLLFFVFTIFLMGVAIGLFEAAIGFWFVYFVRVLLPKAKPLAVHLGVGAVLALSVIYGFYKSVGGFMDEDINWRLFIFPGLPAVICLFAFHQFLKGVSFEPQTMASNSRASVTANNLD